MRIYHHSQTTEFDTLTCRSPLSKLNGKYREGPPIEFSPHRQLVRQGNSHCWIVRSDTQPLLLQSSMPNAISYASATAPAYFTPTTAALKR